MNTSQAKLLSWGAAGVVGVALSLYVAYFVRTSRRIKAHVTTEEMTAKLEDVEEIISQAADIIPYTEVDRALIGYNFSGKPKPQAQAR